MKLVKFRTSGSEPLVGLLENGEIRPLSFAGGQYQCLADILEAEYPPSALEFLIDSSARPVPLSEVIWLPPIDRQEVWAAGVTYRRSQTARMEESEGAAWCYSKVYESPRPELFLKANPHRVVGHRQAVRIRSDATWNVPEPELALVLNSRLRLVGFTIGNDMSSRDIEGENPLYLPQAKTYDACCALGPFIVLRDWLPGADEAPIKMIVSRAGAVVFEGQTCTDQMARTFADLVGWLGRDNTFPNGVFLLTGTGLVPPNEFTLASGDEVEISIGGIGTLTNTVVQG